MMEMTMTENVEFTPEQQAKIDEIVKQRVARERDRLEKESGVEDLRAQLVARDEEIADLKREHYRADARRAVLDELGGAGVTDEGRIERVMKHVDLDALEPGEDGQPDRRAIQLQLAAVNRDMPELLTYRVGAGSRGSKSPVLKTEKPLTRDDLENMGPDEINSRWDTVRKFLAGERG
jgi:hypothetical protein